MHIVGAKLYIGDIALSLNFSIVLSDIVKDRWTDRHGTTLKQDLENGIFSLLCMWERVFVLYIYIHELIA